MNGDTGKERSVSIIRKEMKKWEKRLEALEREYRRMPEGEILIIKKGGRYCCYVYRDRQVKSIRKDCRSTGRLMRKRILGYEIAIAKAFCVELSRSSVGRQSGEHREKRRCQDSGENQTAAGGRHVSAVSG